MTSSYCSPRQIIRLGNFHNPTLYRIRSCRGRSPRMSRTGHSKIRRRRRAGRQGLFLSSFIARPTALSDTLLRLSINAASTSRKLLALFSTSVSLITISVRVYNLVTANHTHLIFPSFLEEFDNAINAWKESIALQPSSPDAHTSPYQLSPQPSSLYIHRSRV